MGYHPHSLSHRKRIESDAKAPLKAVRLARLGRWKAASAFSVAVFVDGFSEIIKFAVVQAHRFAANNAWDGSEKVFHRR
jgi:hypothetical protein